MLKLSNPRSECVLEDYPLGRNKRGEARYTVETAEKGQAKGQSRVSRVTVHNGRQSKPKKTNYYVQIALVDGDDDKNYIIAKTEYNQYILMDSTMKYPIYHYLEPSGGTSEEIENEKAMAQQIKNLLSSCWLSMAN